MKFLIKKSVSYRAYNINNIISIDIFIDKYYISYCGIYSQRKRGAKRCSWIFELIRHSDNTFNLPNTNFYIKKALDIRTDVEPSYYKYEDIMVSGYLIRKLLLQTTKPEIIDEFWT